MKTKQILSMSAFALFSIATHAIEFNVNDFYFRTTENAASVEIFSPKIENAYHELRTIEIPSQVDFGGKKYTVNAIGDSAFAFCDQLENITLPHTIIRIGECAFLGCAELRKIILPQSLQCIDNHAFDESGLISLTIPENVTFVGKNSFQNCDALKEVHWNAIECKTVADGLLYPIFYNDSNISSFIFDSRVQCIPSGLCYEMHIESVVLPDSIKSIGFAAFCLCRDLKNIVFPVSLEEIGNYAFDGCSGLSHLIIPEKVRVTGENAFRNCDGLQTVQWNAIDCYVPTTESTNSCNYFPIFYNDTNITSFTFGKDVQSIPTGICFYLKKIKHIEIPSKVKTIRYQAFSHTSIQSVTLPEGLKNIQKKAFEYNSKLTSLHLPESLDEIGESAFEGCKCLHKITIPSNVRHIGMSAFGFCNSLSEVVWNSNHYNRSYKMIDINPIFGSRAEVKSFVFGPNVTAIPCQLCAKLNKLESVVFSGELTNIGIDAFRECSALHSIILPGSLQNIEDGAFLSCGLDTIVISENLKTIGNCAFALNPVKYISWNAYNCTFIATRDDYNVVTVFGGDAEDYWMDEYEDKRPKVQCIIGNAVTSLPDNMFDAVYFTKIVLPDAVKSVEIFTFRDCYFNGMVYNTHLYINFPKDYSGVYIIPDGIETIASGAFAGCENLTGIQIPESVTTIGSHAFAYSGLKSVFIPKNVNKIVGGVFSSCQQLYSIIVDKNNPIYDSRDQCNAIIATRLNELVEGCNGSTIPPSVQAIGRGAFAYCSKITDVRIPENVTFIDDYAFAASGIQSVYIGCKVNYIGEKVFADCDHLTHIQVSKNNKVYSSGKQNNLLVSNLDSVLILMCGDATIPSYVRVIKPYAAANSNLRYVVIPNNVVEIQKYAFAECRELKKVRLGKRVQTLGEGAFINCVSLKKITIPASVTDLGDYVFAGCEGLRECYFAGLNQVSVKTSWFWGCSNLRVKGRKSAITIL